MPRRRQAAFSAIALALVIGASACAGPSTRTETSAEGTPRIVVRVGKVSASDLLQKTGVLSVRLNEGGDVGFHYTVTASSGDERTIEIVCPDGTKPAPVKVTIGGGPVDSGCTVGKPPVHVLIELDSK
jgi:hypothetical protein